MPRCAIARLIPSSSSRRRNCWPCVSISSRIARPGCCAIVWGSRACAGSVRRRSVRGSCADDRQGRPRATRRPSGSHPPRIP
jgi:hypothetical protein